MIFQPKLFSTLETYSFKQFYADIQAAINRAEEIVMRKITDGK